MNGVPALAVIGQDLDYPAVINAAMAASLDHQLQLSFQGGQAGDALLHLNQAGSRDRVGCCAWLGGIVLQREKGANGFHLEAKLASVSDEG